MPGGLDAAAIAAGLGGHGMTGEDLDFVGLEALVGTDTLRISWACPSSVVLALLLVGTGTLPISWTCYPSVVLALSSDDQWRVHISTLFCL